MRILWVSTLSLGPAQAIKNNSNTVSGGWIQTEYESSNFSNDEMFFLAGTKEKDEVINSNMGTLYLVKLPLINHGVKPNKNFLKKIKNIIERINPDIIQLWGTESCIQYAVSLVDKNRLKILFIQGIIGIHARYIDKKLFFIDGNFKRIVNPIQLLKKRLFVNQSKFEKYIIKNCKAIITDNDFSKAYVDSITDNANYVNRYLIPAKCYYEQNWSCDNCIKNSIFTIFPGTLEKGFGQLVKALVIVKKTIPNIKLYIPGDLFEIVDNKIIKPLKRDFNKYYIFNSLLENNLFDNVIFLGKLNREQMSTYLKKCNIFVNPSKMEVHALSLREAMAVGIPCITTFCGCVNEYAIHNINSLIYRYEEYEVLAMYILKLINDIEMQKKFSINSKKLMIEKSKLNEKDLRTIYSSIVLGE